MAITHVNSNGGTTTSQTTHTCTLSTFTTDDVIVAVFRCTQTDSTVTIPSGWTLLWRDERKVAVCYRVMQSGDGSTVNFVSGVSSNGRYAFSTFRGVDTSTPIDANGDGKRGTGSNNATNTGVIKTNTDNAWAIGFYTHSGVLTWSWSGDTGWSDRIDSNSICIRSKPITTAGTVDSSDATAEYDVSAEFWAGIFALRESGESPTNPTLDLRPESFVLAAGDLWQATKSVSNGYWSPPQTTAVSDVLVRQCVLPAIPAANSRGEYGWGLEVAANNYPGTTSVWDLGTTLPDDFESMLTLSIRCSTAERPANDDYVDDPAFLSLSLQVGEAGALLAGGGGPSNAYGQGIKWFNDSTWQSAGYGLTGNEGFNGLGGPPGYNETVSFGYLNTTATKSDWEDARLTIIHGDDRNMGSDAGSIILSGLRFEGTYTPVATQSLPARQPNARHRHMLVR